MVNKLCLGLADFGSHYYDIAERLNKHYESRLNRSIATLRRVYFKDLWTGTATIAAVVILVLTFIGTVASVLQVMQKENNSSPPPAPPRGLQSVSCYTRNKTIFVFSLLHKTMFNLFLSLAPLGSTNNASFSYDLFIPSWLTSSFQFGFISFKLIIIGSSRGHGVFTWLSWSPGLIGSHGPLTEFRRLEVYGVR